MKSKNEIQNPIQFFEDLIYYRHIISIKRDFSKIDDYYNHYVSYDEKTETMTHQEQSQETGEWETWSETFENYITEKVTNETLLAIRKIDILILNQDSFDKKSELAKSIIDNLIFLNKHLSKQQDIKKYEIIEKSLNNIITHLNSKHNRLLEIITSTKHKSTTYVSPKRIEELKVIKSNQFDLSKLIRMLGELNIAYSNDSFITCAILVRVILDHVPPIFGATTFKILSSQYPGKTIKKLINNLEDSSRKVADNLLHSPIQVKEILPTEIQIDSKKELDILLGEIVKKLN